MKKIIISQLALMLLLISCNSYNENSDFVEHSETELSSSDELVSEGNSDAGYFKNEKLNTLALTKDLSSDYSTSSNGVSNGGISNAPKKVKNNYNSKIIRTADLKLKVENVNKSSSKISNLVDMNGGYVSSQNLSSDKNYYQSINSNDDFEIREFEIVTSNVIYVRVPSKNFHNVLKSIKGIALSEDYIKINTQDVSEEYVDLETRLKTKKEVEARYIEILRSKAKTLSDILTAEDKIRVIREEIEAVEGRLNFLNNKVNLSTIQIEIYQDTYYTQEQVKINTYEATDWNFGEKVIKSISSGWNGILWFVVGILYFWPFLLIGGIVFFIVRRKLAKRK
jgi:hypothetical protein